MGIDIAFGPPEGFQEWTADQWDEYAENEGVDGDTLGSYTSVGGLLETMSANLEGGEIGARFPMVARLVDSESRGWYLGELGALLAELTTLRSELASLPLEKMHFVDVSDSGMDIGRSTPAQVEEARRDFAEVYPGRPLNNVADFHHYFLDTLEDLAERAQASHHGLVIV